MATKAIKTITHSAQANMLGINRKALHLPIFRFRQLLARLNAMATSSKTEKLIRSYIDSVGTTDKPVVDKEAVKALKAQIKSEEDSIEKLRLIATLKEEQQGHVPDRSTEEAAFVAEAKAWADSEGIPASAFQELRVPDDILRKAGFSVTPSGRSGGSRRSGTRAPKIAIDDVKATAAGLGARWTLNDLADALDREPATVRNYVNKLVDDGEVTNLGDDPAHDGRGRAPKLYAMK